MALQSASSVTKATLTIGELETFGESLGRTLVAPHVVAVSGDLGAGKTTLIKAICRGYQVPGEVTSPTFALVHRYEAVRSPVFHLDLYRLRDESELTNIGWDDILSERAIVLVEWPERAGERLPAEATRISLAHVDGDTNVRALHVEAT